MLCCELRVEEVDDLVIRLLVFEEGESMFGLRFNAEVLAIGGAVGAGERTIEGRSIPAAGDIADAKMSLSPRVGKTTGRGFRVEVRTSERFFLLAVPGAGVLGRCPGKQFAKGLSDPSSVALDYLAPVHNDRRYVKG